MKTVNGQVAIEVLRQYVDEDYARINFNEIEETLQNNSQTFDVEALVDDLSEALIDYRFFDPYRHLPVQENSCRYILPSGWTHWQMESESAREYEGYSPERAASGVTSDIRYENVPEMPDLDKMTEPELTAVIKSMETAQKLNPKDFEQYAILILYAKSRRDSIQFLAYVELASELNEIDAESSQLGDGVPF